jgi:hypothetical protein
VGLGRFRLVAALAVTPCSPIGACRCRLVALSTGLEACSEVYYQQFA